MIGDLEGAPTPIEVKVFGDDLDTLAGDLRRGRRHPRAHQRRRRHRRPAARHAGSDLGDRSGGGRTAGPVGGAGLGAVVGRVARRRADRAAADRPHHSGAGALSGRLPHGPGSRWRRRRSAPPTAGRFRSAASRTRPARKGRSSCSARTSSRWSMVTGHLEDRDLGSAVAEIQAKLREPEAAGRLHDRSRRPVRVAAAVVSRAADGVRDRGGAGLHHPAGAVRPLHAGAADPRRGAAVAGRRVRAAAAHRHGPERRHRRWD